MERFLSQAAKYIHEKHAEELHEICIVFPNRRAGVFFTSYLQNEISKSVLAPEVTTIGELFSKNSELFKADQLQLISILYTIFCKHTGTKESFDEFYFWGEILLGDFNDIDRYLIDASDIFTNISDIKEIESVFDYLTPEQKKALEHFWGSVAVNDKKAFQQKHIDIWGKLFPVYSEFKTVLKSKQLAFGGMIDREVAENIQEKTDKLKFKKYYFVGLNALNKCEKKIFLYLQGNQKADFLWDYDMAYYSDPKNEAGRFMRENLQLFPSPLDFVLDKDTFQKSKSINLVAVSSSYGQSQQIPNFLEETKSDFIEKFDNTAVVLADESILFSSLSAMPEKTGTVNVTMGYPVKNSMIYGFLNLLVSLLKNIKVDDKSGTYSYHRYVTNLLNHQLLTYWKTNSQNIFLEEIKSKNKITIALKLLNFTDFHKTLFTVPTKVKNYSRYFLDILGALYLKLVSSESDNKMLLEIIFTTYQAIERLESAVTNVMSDQHQEISQAVYFRLFTQYLGSVSVAFEGEPLSGVQVMGILETRCLDFTNLIILGLNENKWPRTFTAPSFIPFNIRKGFGLPGIDEQDAMYSYYFYRLIQRAKNVTATYSVVKQGISTGELSRYGYQLIYDSKQEPKMINLDYSFANTPTQAIEIKSTKEIVEKLLGNNSSEYPLSPSAINTYLQCSLRFYFRYVMKLPEPDEIKEEIDGMIFGNIFHDTIETLYKPFENKEIRPSDIDTIKQNKIELLNEIHKQIGIHYFKEKANNKKPVILEGKMLLIFENIKTYLYQLLKVDKQIAPFKLISLEEKYKSSVNITLNNKAVQIFIGGKIDRVDFSAGSTRILDYKTGYVKSFSFQTIEELFERDIKESKKEILQALIYSWAYSDSSNSFNIQPVIYSLRDLFRKDFSPNIKWGKLDFDFQEHREKIVSNLIELVSEIYSPDNTFSQTVHPDKCGYCAFQKICQRF